MLRGNVFHFDSYKRVSENKVGPFCFCRNRRFSASRESCSLRRSLRLNSSLMFAFGTFLHFASAVALSAGSGSCNEEDASIAQGCAKDIVVLETACGILFWR